MNETRKLYKWTKSEVEQYWNEISKWYPETYFSSETANNLIRKFNLLQFLNGSSSNEAVLDFGCGEGHFISKLINQFSQNNRSNLTYYAAGFGSDIYLKNVRNNILKSSKINADSLNVINVNEITKINKSVKLASLIEVLEHLDEYEAIHALQSISKLQIPGQGRILITVPYEEKLFENSIYFPLVDSYLHRWQHVQSYTSEKLHNQLMKSGYKIISSLDSVITDWYSFKKFFRSFSKKTLQRNLVVYAERL